MFAMTLQGGMCFAFPDVCKTPTPVGPIPIPYPNTAMGQTANSATCAQKVYFAGQQAFTLKTKIPMSNGDEAGVAGGVVSNKFKSEVGFTQGCTNVLIEGSPAIHLTSPSKHNDSNTVGLNTTPSETTVLIIDSSTGGETTGQGKTIEKNKSKRSGQEENRGKLIIQVKDKNNNIVYNAQVSISHKNQNFSETTDSKGFAYFENIPSGLYEVIVKNECDCNYKCGRYNEYRGEKDVEANATNRLPVSLETSIDVTEDFIDKLKKSGNEMWRYFHGLDTLTTRWTEILDNTIINAINKHLTSLKDADITELLTDEIREDFRRRPFKFKYFAEKVGTGMDWDYKSNVYKGYTKTGLCIAGKWYFYDVPGNVAYGYAGRAAGFKAVTLKVMAGLKQKNDDKKNGKELKSKDSNYDEPRDQDAVQAGIDLYDGYKLDITAERLDLVLSPYHEKWPTLAQNLA